jgi:multidrug efflux pump
MTSLAFFFGTLPLALTRGAGAAAQNAIGTAVNRADCSRPPLST